MNTKARVLAAIVIALTVWIPAVSAQDTDEPSEELQKLWDMSPDERDAAVKNMSEEERNGLKEAARAYRARQRAIRADMTPEEREVERQKGRERFEALSPEEQEAFKKRQIARRKARNKSSQ
jgi:hypothetical protein